MDTTDRTETRIDDLFARVKAGDRVAFAHWMGRVERPIRMSLRRFAQAVDVEAIVQETLLRMWLIATGQGRELQGPDASLRFAIGLARNLARNEARHRGRIRFLPPEDVPEVAQEPLPPSDPGLEAAIRDCIAGLSARLREVLQARLAQAATRSDREIASRLNMKTNTFLQNVVRGRLAMRSCLERRGVPAYEVGA